MWYFANFSNFNTDLKVCVYSLEDVLMEESRLYLIFEFLSMDLKKYLDSLGSNKMMDTSLVRSYLYQVKLKIYYFQKWSWQKYELVNCRWKVLKFNILDHAILDIL
jgi:hypothetical protein